MYTYLRIIYLRNCVYLFLKCMKSRGGEIECMHLLRHVRSARCMHASVVVALLSIEYFWQQTFIKYCNVMRVVCKYVFILRVIRFFRFSTIYWFLRGAETDGQIDYDGDLLKKPYSAEKLVYFMHLIKLSALA